jgi:type IV pilus assembly protein PilE
MYFKYSADFAEIDFEAPKTTNENGSANYSYEITKSTNNEFKVKVIAITDLMEMAFLMFGKLTKNSVPKQVVKD